MTPISRDWIRPSETAENGRWDADEERAEVDAGGEESDTAGGDADGGDGEVARRRGVGAVTRASREGATVEGEEGKEVNADADVGWVSFGRVREARIFLPTAAGSRPSRI